VLAVSPAPLPGGGWPQAEAQQRQMKRVL
jgi:hypothetical protein